MTMYNDTGGGAAAGRGQPGAGDQGRAGARPRHLRPQGRPGQRGLQARPPGQAKSCLGTVELQT